MYSKVIVIDMSRRDILHLSTNNERLTELGKYNPGRLDKGKEEEEGAGSLYVADLV